MNPNDEIAIYLARWKALKDDDGLERVKKVIVWLRLTAIAAAAGMLLSVYFHFHPFAIALAGIVFGYTMAENAALQSRTRTWKRMQEYLDWERIESELDRFQKATDN